MHFPLIVALHLRSAFLRPTLYNSCRCFLYLSHSSLPLLLFLPLTFFVISFHHN